MDKKPVEIKIYSDYITLGQFLKFADVIQTGGEAKFWLSSHTPLINNEEDNRRGRKLRVGDEVKIDSKVYKIV